MKSLNVEHFESKVYKIWQATGKRVLLRTCLNFATDLDGNMSDATRYHESFPLIKQLVSEASFLLITAHLGRPQAQESQFSFRKICEQLSQDLGKPVTFVTSLEQLNALIQQSGLTQQSGLFFLENVRFRPGEESKDSVQRMRFAQQLAQHAELFINDAFADYRASASRLSCRRCLDRSSPEKSKNWIPWWVLVDPWSLCWDDPNCQKSWMQWSLCYKSQTKCWSQVRWDIHWSKHKGSVSEIRE